MARIAKLAVGAVALVVVLAACGIGETTPAVHVTDQSAELTGVAHDTVTGTTYYWFEYGKTTSYTSSTQHRALNVTDTSRGYPVKELVLGLAESTTYHARLCVKDADGKGVCGSDQPFTTAAAEDFVSGAGTVFRDPQLGFSIAASAFATSDPDGSNPAGDASNSGLSSRFALSGPVTCLRVVGNRATIGFLASPPNGVGSPDDPPTPTLIFIEDNGTTGDRYGTRDVTDATTCPAPTVADFPNFAGGILPPVLAEGDFVVHDHAPPL